MSEAFFDLEQEGVCYFFLFEKVHERGLIEKERFEASSISKKREVFVKHMSDTFSKLKCE